jgi:hypothetical protein
LRLAIEEGRFAAFARDVRSRWLCNEAKVSEG